jgi:hypothetical protein
VWGGVAGAGIGGASAPVLFTRMITRYGWRAGVFIAGTATAMLALAWQSTTQGLRHNADYESHAQPHASEGKLLNRDLALLTVAYCGTSYFEYISFYWLFYYFGLVRHAGIGKCRCLPRGCV